MWGTNLPEPNWREIPGDPLSPQERQVELERRQVEYKEQQKQKQRRYWAITLLVPLIIVSLWIGYIAIPAELKVAQPEPQRLVDVATPIIVDITIEFKVDQSEPQQPLESSLTLLPTDTPIPQPASNRPLSANTPIPRSGPTVVDDINCPIKEACITEPRMNARLRKTRGIIPIKGTAAHPNFKYYKLEYRAETQQGGICQNPQANVHWSWLGPDNPRSKSPVKDGVLWEWDIQAIPPGVYCLRLVVVDNTENYWPPEEVRVIVEN